MQYRQAARNSGMTHRAYKLCPGSASLHRKPDSFAIQLVTRTPDNPLGSEFGAFLSQNL